MPAPTPARLNSSGGTLAVGATGDTVTNNGTSNGTFPALSIKFSRLRRWEAPVRASSSRPSREGIKAYDEDEEELGKGGAEEELEDDELNEEELDGKGLGEDEEDEDDKNEEDDEDDEDDEDEEDEDEEDDGGDEEEDDEEDEEDEDEDDGHGLPQSSAVTEIWTNAWSLIGGRRTPAPPNKAPSWPKRKVAVMRTESVPSGQVTITASVIPGTGRPAAATAARVAAGRTALRLAARIAGRAAPLSGNPSGTAGRSSRGTS